MDVLKLAGRYLRTRRIAIVCVFSVAVGVMALIVVTSLMDGVQRFYRSTIKGTMADLWVTEQDLPASADNGHFGHVARKLEPLMEKNGGPIAALAPRLMGSAIIVRGEILDRRDEESNEGIRLFGVDYARERELVPLDRMLDEVKDSTLAVPEGERDDPFAHGVQPAILLGDKLARRLGVARVPGPGTTDRVSVFSVELTRDPKTRKLEAPTRKMVFRVAGCFTTGREDYDGHLAYLDRDVLRRLRFGFPGRQYDATRIYARLVEGAGLQEAKQRIVRECRSLACSTWEEDNRNMLIALKDQKRILVVILALIVGVACAAILGLIAMMVREKVKDIGILRSMGMGRGRVVLVFTIYGLLLGVIGSAVGLLLGLQVTANLDSVVSGLSDLTGVNILNPQIYKFEAVPTHIDPSSITMIIVGVLAASLVSSVIPSMWAAFLLPVRCLRQD